MARFADSTYVKTRQGWLYLVLVMDIWSRRIVGWAIGPQHHRRAGRRRAEDGPGQAKQPEGLRASFGSRIPVRVAVVLSKTMREHGVCPSMGSISSPWDNAAVESLMGIVKSECVHAHTYATRKEAALNLFEYIEVVYNRTRIHSALGYLSPAEFEKANWPAEDSRSKAA